MSKTPRIIAASASAALLAATGAGAAVFAVDTIKENPNSGKSAKSSKADSKPTDIKTPKDDNTTVYRAPSQAEANPPSQNYSYNPPSQNAQPAPPSTGWKSNSGAGSSSGSSSKASKSHSS